MRLFLSLPLPNHVAEHLQKAVHSVEAAAPQTPGNRRPALRWVPEEQRHITLAFYGEHQRYTFTGKGTTSGPCHSGPGPRQAPGCRTAPSPGGRPFDL